MTDKNQKAIQIYDEIAEEYSRIYDSIDGEEDLIFVKAFLSNLNPNDYVADIGCGTGFSSGLFAQNGMRTEGSDLSSKMIEIARRNYPNLNFSVADMRTFKPAESPDAVWAGYSMFHFDENDFRKTIDNIKSYIKQRGIFGLVMQEGNGEVEVPQPLLPNASIYIHLYTEDELRKILEDSGFETLGVKRKAPLYPNELSYNKILVIARFK